MIEIKKILIATVIFIVNISVLNATIYENSEDGTIDRWTISDNDPAGAVVSNIYDENIQSRVIELNGSSYANQYMIGDMPTEDGAWDERDKFNLLWDIKNSNGFLIDVILETQNGIRYIRYSDNESDLGLDGDTINHGLGYDSADGSWHSFNRNLELDLKEFESNNRLISVNGLMIRGDCRVDNIELINNIYNGDFITYEDGEDNNTNGWIVSDSEPSGATIENVFDSDSGSRVIELNGSTYENEYQFGGGWNNSQHFNLKWDMKTTQGFIVDIIVSSTDGDRYMRYTDNEKSEKGKEDDIIYHGLGYYPTDGTWHTFSRNLENDLKEIEPNNQLISIEGFLIRGNCRLDNIELFKTQNKIYEDAEDNQSSRWSIYLGSEDANISNIYDIDKKSRVISMEGNGYENQYIIGGDSPSDIDAWGDTKHSNIRWSLKNSDGFIIYLTVNSQNGVRYLRYSDNDFAQKGIDGSEIYYGLGYGSSDGKWHTFVRDIDADIKEFEPDNSLLSVEGFLLIGSARVDDLELFNILHPSPHQAGLTLTFDDHNVDGWFSMRDTYLEYGTKATFFLDDFHNLTTEQIDRLKTLEQDGHEIGCHTYSHEGIGRDYNYDTDRIDEYLQAQIIPALNNMKDAGFNPTSLAYPYGEHETSYDTAVREYFPYLRTTASDSGRELYELNEIYHKKGKQYNILAGDGIDNSYDNEIDEIREALLKARKEGEIITLYAHEVLDDPDNHYAISPEKIKLIVETAKDMGLKFYTFKESYLVGQ